MRAVFAIFTLAATGVIIADLAAHPDALKAGLNGLNSILSTTFSSMLGVAPGAH